MRVTWLAILLLCLAGCVDPALHVAGKKVMAGPNGAELCAAPGGDVLGVAKPGTAGTLSGRKARIAGEDWYEVSTLSYCNVWARRSHLVDWRPAPLAFWHTKKRHHPPSPCKHWARAFRVSAYTSHKKQYSPENWAFGTDLACCLVSLLSHNRAHARRGER